LQEHNPEHSNGGYYTGYTLDLPQLDFSTLLVMSANIREVQLYITCSSLEALDLCMLRNALLDGGCSLELFTALVRKGVTDDFVKPAFRVTVKSKHVPHRTIEFQAEPRLKQAQLYSTDDFPTGI
ncbi:hypothetical protein PENTCL1PPCAC_19749, partial [Pristionchus entomophagus]